MYPVKLKSTAAFVDELYMCEEGSYEDTLKARKQHPADTTFQYKHTCEILPRYKTIISMETPAELKEIYYSLASGVIGLYRCRAANKLLDQIRDEARRIDPDLVRRFPYQNGM